MTIIAMLPLSLGPTCISGGGGGGVESGGSRLALSDQNIYTRATGFKLRLHRLCHFRSFGHVTSSSPSAAKRKRTESGRSQQHSATQSLKRQEPQETRSGSDSRLTYRNRMLGRR